MAPTPPVAVPPVVAEYSSTLQPAGAQVPAPPQAYRFSRASNGQTRVDSGNMSVISNPATAQMIVLDHAKKTATVQPTPAPAPPNPGMPQMPGFSPPTLPGLPQAPAVQVQDLGKTLLQGHEVQGQRFVIPPVSPPKPPSVQMPAGPSMATPTAPQMPGMPAAAPKLPQIPGMPGVPKLPQMPGMPGAPKPPQTAGVPPVPAAPQPPATAEVWSSTSMSVPMLTKVSGSFGQLTQVCHSAVPGEPHPSAFQIPQGYKVTGT